MQTKDKNILLEMGQLKGRFHNVHEMMTQLKQVLNKTSQSAYYFRGQVHPWRLRSSLHRCQNSTEEIKKTLRFVEWLKQNKYLDNENKQPELNDYLAVAQHYGYKTDLIDFTTDIDVSAFFATDFSSLEDLPKEKLGCLWCVPFEEIKILQNLFQYEVKRGTITDPQIIEIFRKNNYSPFFEFDFPGLSRLKNQAGVFLWDYQGLFTSFYFDGPDCIFHQTAPGAYTTQRVNKQFIYPEPNAVEREIERYGYTKNTLENMESEVYQKLLASSKVYNIQSMQTTHPSLANALKDHEWKDNDWKKCSTDFYPNNEIYNRKISSLPNSTKTLLQRDFLSELMSSYRKNLADGCILEYQCELSFWAQIINEVIHTLNHYPYSDTQCGEVLYYSLQYAATTLRMFEEKNLCSWHGELYCLANYIPLKTVAEEIYGGSVVQVELADTVGVRTRGFVCAEYLENVAKSYKADVIKNAMAYLKNNHQPYKENFGYLQLLNIVTKPRKLFDFEDICHIFVKYILPFQFIFRPKESRIYIPSFVETFGYA